MHITVQIALSFMDSHRGQGKRGAKQHRKENRSFCFSGCCVRMMEGVSFLPSKCLAFHRDWLRGAYYDCRRGDEIECIMYGMDRKSVKMLSRLEQMHRGCC